LHTLSHEDQIAWSKISESAKKKILGTPDNEKGRDNNPIVVVNNHEMIFEDKEEDATGNDNPSISAQSHSSSKRSIVASVRQSDSTRRTIQANTSTLRNTEESKYQDPEERGLLYVATHKTTKSSKEIDVNNAFTKAVEKKSTDHVSWDNDIAQPTSERYKKPQIRVNMASRKKVVYTDDGTIVESPDEQTTLGQVATTPHTAASTQPGTDAAIRGNRTRPRPAMTVARGRGRGRTPGSHYFGAVGQGGRNFQASAPDGCTHLIPRSIRNAPPQQTVSEQYVPGVNIPSTQQVLLSRCMGETNPTTSYIARSRDQLPINSIPRHTGIREDGTFISLDGNVNSHAMVPYGVQPDPIVSQQAIVTAPSGPTEGDSASTLVLSSVKLHTDSGIQLRLMLDAQRTVLFQESLFKKTVQCMDPVSTGFRGVNNKTEERRKLVLKLIAPGAKQVLSTKMTLKTLTSKGEQMLTPKGEQLRARLQYR